MHVGRPCQSAACEIAKRCALSYRCDSKLCKGDMSQNSKTAELVLRRYYRVLNSRLALIRLAILNTWNKNTKTKVTSRNNVEYQFVKFVKTPRILQWTPMPMVEGHVQACLNFSLSFCLHVRAVAWRHSDNKSVKRWNATARLYSVAMGQIPRSTECIFWQIKIHRSIL